MVRQTVFTGIKRNENGSMKCGNFESRDKGNTLRSGIVLNVIRKRVVA